MIIIDNWALLFKLYIHEQESSSEADDSSSPGSPFASLPGVSWNVVVPFLVFGIGETHDVVKLSKRRARRPLLAKY